MGAIASQITSLTIVYSTICSDADQRKHQSSASLAFVRGIHRGPVNSPHKWPVTRKMCPFDDVIMIYNEIPHYTPHPTKYEAKWFAYFVGYTAICVIECNLDKQISQLVSSCHVQMIHCSQGTSHSRDRYISLRLGAKPVVKWNVDEATMYWNRIIN